MKRTKEAKMITILRLFGNKNPNKKMKISTRKRKIRSIKRKRILQRKILKNRGAEKNVSIKRKIKKDTILMNNLSQ